MSWYDRAADGRDEGAKPEGGCVSESAAQLALEGVEGLLAVEAEDDPVELRPPLEEAVDLGEQ